MKKIWLFIFLIQTSLVLIPSATKKGIMPNIRQKISPYVITPLTDYVKKNSMLQNIINFYTNPKYEKIHGLIYGLKSPIYQEEYYNPTLRWLNNYWKNRISDHFIDYHRNTMDPIIQRLPSSDKTKHAKKIDDYNNAYMEYRTANTQQKKLRAQKNLLEKRQVLETALHESSESKSHAR